MVVAISLVGSEGGSLVDKYGQHVCVERWWEVCFVVSNSAEKPAVEK